MNNLTLIFVLIIIILFNLIKFRKNYNFKIPKKKRAASTKKTGPRKPFFFESFKEVIRWGIPSVILLILMMYLVNFGVSSYKEITNNSKNKTNVITKKQSCKQVLGYIDVSFDGEYGDRVYLLNKFSKNTLFEFVDATTAYSVINEYGKEAFALSGQDASDQLGFSDGNFVIRFKGQNNQNGSLKIKAYLKK